MYSNSSSFFGGGNSMRPGALPYGNSFNAGSGQQQQQPQQQQQQQQPLQHGPFAPQPTGFAQAPIQQQYTGYPVMQKTMQTGHLQPQYTGFSGQQQKQGFQSSVPPMPSIPQQFQQQFQQQQQQQPQSQQPASFLSSQPQNKSGLQAQSASAASMNPQPTGFSQMAASFQTGGQSAPKPAQASKGTKIPNIRLSFITAQDQAKFETLFKSAVGDGQTTMSGEKARDILMRSRLDGEHLSQIWTLADTTRSGQLHFPEFALAMYLCNLRMNGKALPSSLPENIQNEVSSMVDIINFSIAEESANASSASNAPDFTVRQNTATPPTIQHPQPQPSNSQLLQAQMTGFPGAQQAFMAQPSGSLQPQQTGYPGMQNPQPTGYTSPRPPIPSIPTGMGPGGIGSMAAPLNAQPTGRPGQWGLVNTPSTGLPNIDALHARMMPQQGREQVSFTTAGLQGNAVIPWAITKDEKTRYDALFRAWDGMNKAYIAGSQAIEIFGQSGLEKPDLERIWTLADHGNKGRLNLDEFAVAMHLIYRKLNGYPLPNSLPPELVPPSTRNLNEAIGTMKSMLHQESDFRKNSGAALLPQKTGVSYLKTHSFRSQGGLPGSSRKDATVFKNDDDAVGYKSSARRRIGNDSPRPDSPSSLASNDDLTIEQIRKKIKEKQVLLNAMDFKDEKALEEDDILDRRDRKEAEDLYRRIRRIQEDIDSHPDAPLPSGDSDAERRALKRQLQNFKDYIPVLASQVRKTEKAIFEARLEFFRLKDAKAHPSSAPAIIGTGPGGAITESDRLKARAKAMMQQRTAALTGKKVEMSSEDMDAPKRLEEENLKARTEKENNERMVRDVEESVQEFARSIEDSLQSSGPTVDNEHERRRWEDALGVEEEVRDFIFDLQRSSRSKRVRTQDRHADLSSADPPRSESLPAARHESPSAPAARTGTPTSASSAAGSYSSYKTPEDRAAFIKQQAEQRMAERLAALGIKAPVKGGETAAQRMERERAERAAKLRQAEEEDSRREVERQARLAEEQGPPQPAAPASKADTKPPPPPSRKAGTDRETAAKKAEEEALAQEQQQQQRRMREMEAKAKAEEDELARENDAAEARLKALEEQVRQGKLKKEEEKRKKKAALAEAKEKESKLAARRQEIEAAKRREEELQRQLEAMNEDTSSDDDDEIAQITPQASTPTVGSQELDRKASPPPQPTTPQPTEPKTESRNPYFRMLSQSSGGGPSMSSQAAEPQVPRQEAQAQAPVPAAPESSTNPFHRMTVPQVPAPAPISRKRADTDDGWGSDKDEDEDEDDSDDDRPGGTSAAQLASILFGTMGPPRPLSAADTKSVSSPTAVASPAMMVSPPPPPGLPLVPAAAAPPVPSTPSPAPEIASAYPPAPPPPPPPMPSAGAPSVPPPPPPPMPSAGAPSVPPPPPPPMPSAGAPSAPPPPPPPPPTVSSSSAPAAAPAGGRPAGLLGEIQAGRTLRKTITQDKSGAAVAGRVLD